jgi:prepilin-type N-terminal cleavage/methylation domain-containing protein
MARGFTLIEMMIVLAIIVILATVGFINFAGVRQHQKLDLAGKSLIAFLRDAQQKAISQESGSAWCVRLENLETGRDSYYLYSGTCSGAPAVVVVLPSNIGFVTPTQDIFFSKVTGLPASAATITIRLEGDPSVTKTITVNAQGTIQE